MPEEAVPTELRVQVHALREEAWPSGPGEAAADDATVHDPALHPQSLLLVESGEVLAALDILTKTLTHAGRSWTAGGLSTVVTASRARGRGLGRELVSTARDLMAEQGGLDLGIFTCDRPLQAFYESAGWRLLPGTVLVGGTPEAPFPSDQPGFDKVTMGAFFSGAAREAAAAFEGARIELYPGTVDKLW